jgi:hypothetical protein
MAVSKRTKTGKPINWSRLSKDRLLEMRICDLNLSLENSPLMSRIEQLNRELQRRGIPFQPHFWLSDEWFCPDGIPGVAIPFYLAHPRLIKLEREFMLEVEGVDRRWCMKLLRHETGHALVNAYQITKRRDWRKVFGNPNTAYHDTYLPRPYSKRYVMNLPNWYAQSHPHEDWAETFAVWLNPKSDWKRRYRNWPAIKKLHYVDELMDEIKQKRPQLRNRRIDHPAEKIRITLDEYYNDKIERYGMDSVEFFDVDLRKLFVSAEASASGEKASRHIRKLKKPILGIVERWTGEYKYRINEALRDMIKRCDELDLYVAQDNCELLPEMTACLTMLVMNKLHSGGYYLSR